MALTVATQVSSGSSSTSARIGVESVVAVAPMSSPWCSHPPPPQARTPPPSTAFRASSLVSSRMLVLLVGGQRPVQAGRAGGAAGELVAGLGVAQDAQSGVGVQGPGEALRGPGLSVGDDGDAGGLHPARV